MRRYAFSTITTGSTIGSADDERLPATDIAQQLSDREQIRDAATRYRRGVDHKIQNA